MNRNIMTRGLKKAIYKHIMDLSKQEEKRIGRLMFKYRTTYGLTERTIFQIVDEVLNSNEYKEAWIEYVHSKS